MSFISIFDIIGPNMVGPSSSHTAGAATISYVARKMFGEDIINIRFVLYGSFAKTYRGHGTDRALLGGALGFSSDDLRIRNSFDIANDMGISFIFEESEKESPHPNTVDIYMQGKNGKKMYIKGLSIGGGKIKIVEINNTKVEFSGQYSTLIIDHKDKKGVLAFISNCLQENNVNIASLKGYRDTKGEIAHSIIECDDNIPKNVVNVLNQNDNIIDVMLVQI